MFKNEPNTLNPSSPTTVEEAIKTNAPTQQMDDHMPQPKIEKTIIPNNAPNTKRSCFISTYLQKNQQNQMLIAYVNQTPTDPIMIPSSEPANKTKCRKTINKMLQSTITLIDNNQDRFLLKSLQFIVRLNQTI